MMAAQQEFVESRQEFPSITYLNRAPVKSWSGYKKPFQAKRLET